MGNPASSQFGPFLIDVGERMLRRDGEPVPLTPKAFDVLVALIEKPGQLISKEELLQKVWPDTFVEESNLAYNIFALRKALGDTAENSQYIETVPKKGYRFRASVSPASPLGNAPPAVGAWRRTRPYAVQPAMRVMARSRSCHSARDWPGLRWRWSEEADPAQSCCRTACGARLRSTAALLVPPALGVVRCRGGSGRSRTCRRPIAVGFARCHAATCASP